MFLNYGDNHRLDAQGFSQISSSMSCTCAATVQLLLLLVQQTSALTGVYNFRCVSPLLPGLYRSANLEQATAGDAAYLLDGARIRTIVDLRNQDEIDKARASSTEMGRKLIAEFDAGAAVGEADEQPLEHLWGAASGAVAKGGYGISCGLWAEEQPLEAVGMGC